MIDTLAAQLYALLQQLDIICGNCPPALGTYPTNSKAKRSEYIPIPQSCTRICISSVINTSLYARYVCTLKGGIVSWIWDSSIIPRRPGRHLWSREWIMHGQKCAKEWQSRWRHDNSRSSLCSPFPRISTSSLQQLLWTNLNSAMPRNALQNVTCDILG